MRVGGEGGEGGKTQTPCREKQDDECKKKLPLKCRTDNKQVKEDVTCKVTFRHHCYGSFTFTHEKGKSVLLTPRKLRIPVQGYTLKTSLQILSRI